MLLSREYRSYIVCHRKDGGSGLSSCLMCNEWDNQKTCSFFVEASINCMCSDLRFDEYCTSFLARDFIAEVDIEVEKIPNLPEIPHRTPKRFHFLHHKSN